METFVNIRKAVATDARRIKELLEQLGYPELDQPAVTRKIESHEKTGYCLLVAEENDLIVAFVSLHWFELMHWQGTIGRITSFCVDDQFRSQGIGKKMLEYVERFLFDEGCEKIEVTSNNRRTRAHEFYFRNGYIEDSRRFIKYK